jgi:hypothetical protein
MAYFEKLVRKILSEHGYRHKRAAKGDHSLWYNAETNISVTVDGEIKNLFP